MGVEGDDLYGYGIGWSIWVWKRIVYMGVEGLRDWLATRRKFGSSPRRHLHP